ncbi:MAG: class I SAM-dependent methyltransferase [Maricaulaceae bacterium]
MTGLVNRDDDAVVITPDTLSRLTDMPASARQVLSSAARLRSGQMRMRVPDGRVLLFCGAEMGPEAEIELKDWRGLSRVAAGGDCGFAEGFMAGEWDSPDVAKVLELFSENLDHMTELVEGHSRLKLFLLRAYHWLHQNTRRGAKKNIHAHYDLGNEFYSQWLDPSMTYSAARYAHRGQKLEDAQRNKYHRLARELDLKPGDHVLEIGSGWGGFAEFAAKDIGARITGLTLSTEQLAFAQARAQNAGLSERMQFKLVDYRDVDGEFDAVVSIEMFEAVGERYWPAYFNKIRSVLKPSGRAGLQIITIRDDLFKSYRNRTDFIQRYVFPGGMLPSVDRLSKEFTQAGLSLNNVETFARDYAETLREWAQRFLNAWDNIRGLGFDERFKRLWAFYLAYCEAGFRTGRTDVAQFTLARR